MANILDHAFSRGFTLLPRIGEMLNITRERQALARLDAEQLADIGISRVEAQQEAARPAWDVPAHWRC